jgi:hypothetical protein
LAGLVAQRRIAQRAVLLNRLQMGDIADTDGKFHKVQHPSDVRL